MNVACNNGMIILVKCFGSASKTKNNGRFYKIVSTIFVLNFVLFGLLFITGFPF